MNCKIPFSWFLLIQSNKHQLRPTHRLRQNLEEFLPMYIETETHLGTTVAFLAPIVIEAVMLPCIAFFGFLSDRFRLRKRLFWIGTLVLLIAAFPEFLIIHSGVVPAIYAFSAVVGVLEGIGAGTLVAFIGENFPTNDRYSGYIGYNFAASYFGGFAPVISIALIAVLNSVISVGFKSVVNALTTGFFTSFLSTLALLKSLVSGIRILRK